nr:hypothetical protein [Tanacetum cinerariifolium]
MYHDLYLGRKALAERGNVGLDLTKSDLCPSFIEDLTAKGVGLRMADSYTEMTFKIFMYSKADEDLTFLLKEPSTEFGTSSPFVSINTMLPVTEAKQLVENTVDSGDSPFQKQLMIHPRSVAARIKDSKCRTRGRSSKPHVKHKLVQGDLSTRTTRAKTVSSKDDSPFLIISDDDECNYEIYFLFPRIPSQLLIVYSYFTGSCRQCHQSKVSRVIKDDRTDEEECDVLKEMEKARRRGEGAQSQSREDVVRKSKVKLEAIEASLCQELENAKRNRAEVVSKVVPYVSTELVHIDELELCSASFI